MSLTIQQVIDGAEDNFGIASGDTTHQSFLLSKFNRDIMPTIRNIILKECKHYFSEVGFADLVADTDLYQPEKNESKVAYDAALPIRTLHALGVLVDGSSQFYRPLENAELSRNDLRQVASTTTFRVWGYYKEGDKIRVVDIPKTSITNGLRFNYTRAYEDLAIGAALPVPSDMAPVVIDGLSYKLAQKLQSDQMTYFRTDWTKGHKMIRSMVADWSDDDMLTEDGSPIQL